MASDNSLLDYTREVLGAMDCMRESPVGRCINDNQLLGQIMMTTLIAHQISKLSAAITDLAKVIGVDEQE